MLSVLPYTSAIGSVARYSFVLCFACLSIQHFVVLCLFHVLFLLWVLFEWMLLVCVYVQGQSGLFLLHFVHFVWHEVHLLTAIVHVLVHLCRIPSVQEAKEELLIIMGKIKCHDCYVQHAKRVAQRNAAQPKKGRPIRKKPTVDVRNQTITGRVVLEGAEAAGAQLFPTRENPTADSQVAPSLPGAPESSSKAGEQQSLVGPASPMTQNDSDKPSIGKPEEIKSHDTPTDQSTKPEPPPELASAPPPGDSEESSDSSAEEAECNRLMLEQKTKLEKEQPLQPQHSGDTESQSSPIKHGLVLDLPSDSDSDESRGSS